MSDPGARAANAHDSSWDFRRNDTMVGEPAVSLRRRAQRISIARADSPHPRILISTRDFVGRHGTEKQIQQALESTGRGPNDDRDRA